MTINYKGSIIELTEQKVMSILNITDNSFYDGGRYFNDEDFIARATFLLENGTDILDLGACSTRPFSEPISEKEEVEAIKWGVSLLKSHFPKAVLSIDTFRCSVASEAIKIWGDVIVNDVYAGDADPKMVDFVAESGVPYIAMHQADIAGDDAASSIIDYFSKKINILERKGVKDIIFDVGFGFNKTLEQNYQILRDYHLFSILERASLVGISRKSMIWKVLENTPADALNGTTVLNTILLQKGANILRVHDPIEAAQAVKIVKETFKF